MNWLMLLILLAGSSIVVAQDQTSVLSGTVLPVTLTKTLHSAEAKPGDIVIAKVAQDVPLASGQVIRAGSKVTGHVVKVFQDRHQLPAKIAMAFDSVEVSGKNVPIVTDLRALAGFVEVEQAQIPAAGPDKGTPADAWTTVQIGGDVVYRGGGPVVRGTETVGKPVNGGVLSRVVAHPGMKCRGATEGNSREQALWVFSSDACGLYGLDDLEIVHAGRTEPVGEIVLSSKKGSLNLAGGTGLLLRVNGSLIDRTSANVNH